MLIIDKKGGVWQSDLQLVCADKVIFTSIPVLNFSSSEFGRLRVEHGIIGAVWPVTHQSADSMVYRIAMNVCDNGSQVFAVVDFFSFEVGYKKAATAVVVFIEGFSVAVEEVREGLGYFILNLLWSS
ncbi:hypothetical protein [Marinoscillum sp.]|uniref:hypothetical protein n=1 Tax=Marinoscillum sp. TaxID=2024838 RepID=UPI003BA95E76